MKEDIVDRATEIYRSEAIIPDILKASAVKGLMGEHFNQVSTEAYAYINCVLFAVLEYTARKTITKFGKVNRLQPEHIQESISDGDVLMLNVGAINVNPEISIDRIVREVVRVLAVKNVDDTVDYTMLLEGEDLSNLGEEKNEQKEQEGG